MQSLQAPNFRHCSSHQLPPIIYCPSSPPSPPEPFVFEESMDEFMSEQWYQGAPLPRQ